MLQASTFCSIAVRTRTVKGLIMAVRIIESLLRRLGGGEGLGIT